MTRARSKHRNVQSSSDNVNKSDKNVWQRSEENVKRLNESVRRQLLSENVKRRLLLSESVQRQLNESFGRKLIENVPRSSVSKLSMNAVLKEAQPLLDLTVTGRKSLETESRNNPSLQISNRNRRRGSHATLMTNCLWFTWILSEARLIPSPQIVHQTEGQAKKKVKAYVYPGKHEFRYFFSPPLPGEHSDMA
jgi:hypothetical protein